MRSGAGRIAFFPFFSLQTLQICRKTCTWDVGDVPVRKLRGGGMASEETLTRAEIAEQLNRQVGLSRAESAQLVEQVLNLVAEALENGENVKISGFGTFVLRDKNERVGRNPKTGIEVPITSRRVLTFRASQSLRERVAKS